VHPVKEAPSSEHSKLLPASSAAKEKLAVVCVVGVGGPEPIVVSGAVRSIVQLYVAGETSVLVAGSLARTWKVCAPAVSPV
jgi:hypothetical protein